MAWLLVAAGLTFVGASAVTTSDRVTPANFSGYATGTGIHAHLLRTGTAGSGYAAGTEVLDVDEAFSAASVNTAGLAAGLQNEVGTLVHPTGSLAGKQASGRGSGLELGLATDVPVSAENRALILSGVAEATAPPDSLLIEEDIGPIQADPLIFASVLHGEAQAKMGTLFNRCPTLPLPDRFGYGEGHLAQAQLVNTGPAALPNLPFDSPLVGTDSAGGERAAFTRSVTYPIDNGDGTFGLVSEVHSTVAPIRISTAPGPLDDIVIRVVGEAVMKVTATGKTGGATVQYTKPATVSIQSGIDLPIDIIPALPPIAIPGIVSLFEDARRIGTDTAPPTPPEIAGNGTVAAAAADVARVTLPNGLLDIRLLHTEARVQVPAGGFSFNDCGRLRITKSVVGDAPGPFNFHVVCPGVTLLATEADFTLANGESKVIAVPSGTQCTVTEPGAGGATQTTGVPATVTIPTNMGFVDVNVVNSNIGILQVIKAAQEGFNGPFAFSASCTTAGGAAVPTSLVPATFTLGRNESRVFPNIPGNSTCTVAETDDGGAANTRVADTTAPHDGTVVIPGGGVAIVTFSNAGPQLVISKQTFGGEAAGKGPFKFHLECTSGGATVPLSAADTDFTLAAGQQKFITQDLPDGTRCVATETDSAGAAETVVTDTDASTGGVFDRAVIVNHGVTHGITFNNNFPTRIKLVVSKTVVGNGTGPFKFHVACTLPAGGAYTLAAGDADFSLNGAQSKSIANIPDGSTCTVTETDARGATRAFAESSGTPNDGVVVIPAGAASAVVGVTNTFVPAPPPPVAVAPIAIQPRTVG